MPPHPPFRLRSTQAPLEKFPHYVRRLWVRAVESPNESRSRLRSLQGTLARSSYWDPPHLAKSTERRAEDRDKYPLPSILDTRASAVSERRRETRVSLE